MKSRGGSIAVVLESNGSRRPLSSRPTRWLPGAGAPGLVKVRLSLAVSLTPAQEAQCGTSPIPPPSHEYKARQYSPPRVGTTHLHGSAVHPSPQVLNPRGWPHERIENADEGRGTEPRDPRFGNGGGEQSGCQAQRVPDGGPDTFPPRDVDDEAPI
jgi:hypothetical protein